jgi:hypothetical protein
MDGFIEQMQDIKLRDATIAIQIRAMVSLLHRRRLTRMDGDTGNTPATCPV